MLRNTVRVGGCQISLKKSVTKMYGSTLLALRGSGWVSNFQKKKRYVTLEWHLNIRNYYLKKSWLHTVN